MKGPLLIAVVWLAGLLAAASPVLPDSVGLQADTVRLSALRDSALARYRLSSREGRYQEAVGYNAEYRLYTDSLSLLHRAQELAEVRAKYDQEALIGEQNLLLLAKERTRILVLIVLIVCLCMTALVVLLYQIKLTRKKRLIHQSQERLKEVAHQIQENTQTIRSNEAIIQTMSEQLANYTEFHEQVNEQQAEIERIHIANKQLFQQNNQLESEVKQCSSQLQDFENNQLVPDDLYEEYQTLQVRERYLSDLLIRQLAMIGSLKREPKPVTPEENNQLIVEMEHVYPGLVEFLRHTFPDLSDLDVLTFCLIKLKFVNSEIAHITGVDPPSVSIRKYRIKEAMRKVRPDLLDGEESLDIYIYKLTMES